ncbi:purine and uridine phosphorylase [Aspergillus karnatakaensis]|uniref:purine and uridine phosphorylase n=1 Tax=Aspergillus karnatakaensis TaxID=1810916 RepID=UPI003CCD9F62
MVMFASWDSSASSILSDTSPGYPPTLWVQEGASKQLLPHEYEIGILCALSLEAAAVRGVFNEIYEEGFRKASNDTLSYTTGKIGRHHAVLGHMAGVGKAQAAVSAQNLRSSFSALKLVLLVGICGGVPAVDPERDPDIALGDIVIGKNVVQIDLGKQYPGQFVRKTNVEDNLGRQSLEVRTFVEKLESCKARLEKATTQNLTALLQKSGFGQSKYPGVHEDKLFDPNYLHKHHHAQSCECAQPQGSCDRARDSTCEQLGCRSKYLIPRDPPGPSLQQPAIFFGSIASCDTVMKSGQHRDDVAAREGIIAFEMEGAGLWDSLPCVIVKGVSDYADSHKNQAWQAHSAAVAAACSVAIIDEWDSAQQPAGAPLFRQQNIWNNDGNTKITNQVGEQHFSGSNHTFNM